MDKVTFEKAIALLEEWNGDKDNRPLCAWFEGERQIAAEYEYARSLALHIWATHYKADAPEWEPCDNLMGVLTQIDNMVTGLGRLVDDEEDKQRVELNEINC